MGRWSLSSAPFVCQIETLGQVVVHLNGTELPVATQRILDHEVELRAVECGLARYDGSLEALVLCGLDDCSLGLLPVLVRADIFLAVVGVAQRHLCRVLVELERAEDVEHDVDNLLELVEQLVGAYEEVGIVLREPAHTRQSVQLTRLLVTVDGTELGQTYGQILVRTWFAAVYLAVVGGSSSA